MFVQTHLPRYVAVAPRPTEATYRRRRLVVLAFVTALAVSVGVSVYDGLAYRGGDPASTSAAGQSHTYVVQPGDTMWAIAERLHGGGDVVGYVDALIALNGGSVIQAGQELRLP